MGLGEEPGRPIAATLVATLRDSSALLLLGEVRLAQARPAEAEPLLREAVEARRKILPEGDWQRAAAESMLGTCLVALGRLDEAEPMLDGAYASLASSKSGSEFATRAALALVDLYTARNAGEKAAEWKARAQGEAR